MTPGSGVTSSLMQAAVGRRRIAFENHRQLEGSAAVLDGGDQVERVLEPLHRRQENMQAAVARLDARGRCAVPPPLSSDDRQAVADGPRVALTFRVRLASADFADGAIARGDLAVKISERRLWREGVDFADEFNFIFGHPGQ